MLDLINVGELFKPLAEELKLRGQNPELPITTLPSLNELIWGIRKRKLTVIGARTSQGKSSLAVQLCYDLALQDKKIVFLSLEMENIECAERLLAYSYEINNKSLLRGEGDKHYQKAIEFGEKMKKKRFVISDCIGRTWQDINGIIENWHKANNVPDVVMVDYIQNIKGIGNQKEVYDEYIRKFREMAIRYNFAGVICSQVNRSSQESEDRSPQLHQLKGTGFLEEHSDIIILLHWPYFYNQTKDKNHFELFIAKNKLGETGRLNVRYYPEYFMFREMQTVRVREEDAKWKE